MCGRYLRRSDKQRIAEAFRLDELPDSFVLPPDYNVAPTTFQPVIRLNRDSGRREIVLMRWGLVPFYAVSLAEFRGISTINARAETLLTRPLWQRPFEKRRCLVPADGFYEWQKLAPTSGKPAAKPTRKPFVYTLRTGKPFAFAGLWDAWKDPSTGDWLQTFAVITTTANPLTAAVHDRMPVILHPRDYDRWLNRGEAHQLPIDLLRPFEAEAMSADACNPAVGNVRNNGPELLTSPPPGIPDPRDIPDPLISPDPPNSA